MSQFGRIYRVTTFGESHSIGVGCTVEGYPSNELVDIYQLNRRRPGQSAITSARDEKDQVQILCGVNKESRSLGSPITFFVKNEDQIPKDYEEMSNIPRPGHADLTFLQKYGIKAESGGGRASARETIGRVCAGALAQSYLEKLKIQVSAWVSSVGEIEIPNEINQKYFDNPPSQEEVDKLGRIGNAQIRNPHEQSAILMVKLIEQVQSEKDSIGGVVSCVISGVPSGLGEPCFDKLPALLAHAMLSIPATKGFEFGSGFSGTKMRGSQHNDRYVQGQNMIHPGSNNAGGTQGGISNGENIYFRVAFKPVSTIGLEQQTCDYSGQEVVLQAKGRHDPCVVPRAVPIVENMAAIVIMDCLRLKEQQKQKF